MSGSQIKKIAAISAVVTFAAILLVGFVMSVFERPLRTKSAAYEEAREIITTLETLRASLRAAAYWYAENIGSVNLDVKRKHWGWEAEHTIHDNSISGLLIHNKRSFNILNYISERFKAHRLEYGITGRGISIACGLEYARPRDYMLVVLDDLKGLYVGYNLKNDSYLMISATIRSGST